MHLETVRPLEPAPEAITLAPSYSPPRHDTAADFHELPAYIDPVAMDRGARGLASCPHPTRAPLSPTAPAGGNHRSGPLSSDPVSQRRRLLYDTWLAMSATRPGITWREAARVLGCGVTLYKLIREVAALGEAAFATKIRNCGARSPWEHLLTDPRVQAVLRDNYAASLASSCEATTNDRHTGDMVKACQHFSRETELCPLELGKKLLRKKIPSCFLRFLRTITPEMEALVRGPKAFQLHGPSGQRAKLIGLPGDRAAYLPAGWVIELDDMSVNQPYWVEGLDGQPILSRQVLFARDVRGRWLGCELVARTRESYQSGDVLRFIEHLFNLLVGMPRKLRIERGVWAARNIAGYRMTTTEDWIEEKILRPKMDEENRANLDMGLQALGIEVEWCHSSRGKADLEGSFHPLQAHLAQFTKDFPNIGRRAGEFERMAKQIRRVRAGSHHPQDLGFPHQNILAQRIQDTFDFINSRLPITDKKTLADIVLAGAPVETLDELWQRDQALCPLLPLPEHADLAFLTELRQPTVRGGAVYPRCDGIEFAFRARELADVGDGYAVSIRFDPGDLTRPAAIYNREPRASTRNIFQLAEGALLCRAEFDAPGFTAHALSVPAGLPTCEVEQIYGRDVLPDGGLRVKQQIKHLHRAVRTAFTGRLPGQPRAATVAARDGRGHVTEITNASRGTRNTESARAPLSTLNPQPSTPARPRLQLVNVSD